MSDYANWLGSMAAKMLDGEDVRPCPKAMQRAAEEFRSLLTESANLETIRKAHVDEITLLRAEGAIMRDALQEIIWYAESDGEHVITCRRIAQQGLDSVSGRQSPTTNEVPVSTDIGSSDDSRQCKHENVVLNFCGDYCEDCGEIFNDNTGNDV